MTKGEGILFMAGVTLLALLTVLLQNDFKRESELTTIPAPFGPF